MWICLVLLSGWLFVGLSNVVLRTTNRGSSWCCCLDGYLLLFPVLLSGWLVVADFGCVFWEARCGSSGLIVGAAVCGSFWFGLLDV